MFGGVRFFGDPQNGGLPVVLALNLRNMGHPQKRRATCIIPPKAESRELSGRIPARMRGCAPPRRFGSWALTLSVRMSFFDGIPLGGFEGTVPEKRQTHINIGESKIFSSQLPSAFPNIRLEIGKFEENKTGAPLRCVLHIFSHWN